MATATDLMGLGTAPGLAELTGNSPQAVTAAGTAATTATALAPQASFLNVTAAGSQDGIRFHASTPLGRPIFIINVSGTTAKIYPATGGAINGGSTDAAVDVATAKTAVVIRYSTTVWGLILTA